MSESNALDEGVIKFDASDFDQIPMVVSDKLTTLNAIRSQLFQMKLIGEYPIEKIGYGNLSVRNLGEENCKTNGFIISGTQTGHLPLLDIQHYTIVTDYDFHKNAVTVRGPVQASSESLTHAAIYECHDRIQCVVHVHSADIWRGMLDHNMPHTSKDIPYGTPQMAEAVKQVINGNSHGVLAMAGHEEGVITFGTSIQEAFELCRGLYERFV